MTTPTEPRGSASLPQQHGVTRPGPGTVTGRVWSIADDLLAALGRPPARREVIAKGTAEGINRATLSTQYAHWKTFNGIAGKVSGPSPALTGPGVVPAADRVGNRAATKLSNQVVGNVGLYFVCYKLSLAGWNVMPTARNARGIDIVLYSATGTRFTSVQVKALSNPAPVPLGSHLNHLLADHIVICRRVASERPECFVMTPAEVRERVHKGVKNGMVTFWLQPKSYEDFSERWDRIGSGLDGPSGGSAL